jgi:hypothetical protein
MALADWTIVSEILPCSSEMMRSVDDELVVEALCRDPATEITLTASL